MWIMIEPLEQGLEQIVTILKFGFEAVSVLCLLAGLIAVGRAIVRESSCLHQPPFLGLRLILGSWLALGLEFQLGADILGTTIAPSFETLGRLGAIALIRTFLNFFLSRELETESQWNKQRPGR